MYLVFPTFEIAPIANGGIGQYISSVIQQLQDCEYIPLVVLYNLPQNRLTDAKNHFDALGLNCEIFHINELSPIQLEPEDVYNIEKNSLALMKGLENLISLKEVAGVEWCDHAGMAFHTLRDKHCNPDSVFKNIPMWLHLHGAREICDLTDRYPVALDSGNSYVLSNYAERLSLELADAWKSPSQAVAYWFTSYFGIHNKIFTSPLPYRKLATQDSHRQIARPAFPIKILVPGRLQHLKGSDIVAQACVELCKTFPNQFHATFAGYNLPTANPNYASSLDEIKSFIPEEFASHFSFPGKFSAEQYLKLAEESHLAVFASRVETFCLAVHELNWIGVPIILPDIPAFKDHFEHQINCYKFDGTVEGLTSLLTQILDNPELLTQIQSQPISDFDKNIFRKLATLPSISKVNSNYALFTRIQELSINPSQFEQIEDSSNLLKADSFKALSVYSLKVLLRAIAWKILKRMADKLSASDQVRLFFKEKLKTLFVTKPT
jgi:glycosyltransferase involved in cell wall biosynthesis